MPLTPTPSTHRYPLSEYVPMSLYGDYVKQVFPRVDFASYGLDVTDWIARDSLELFLEYCAVGEGGTFVFIEGDARVVQRASRLEVDAYRRFVLPPSLERLSYFSYENVDMWVSPQHFAVYLERVYDPLEVNEEPSTAATSEWYYKEISEGCSRDADTDDTISGEEKEEEEEEDPDDLTQLDNSTQAEDPDDDDDDGPLSLSPRFVLPEFQVSRPVVIPCATSGGGNPEVTELCVFPNFNLFIDLYFRKPSDYMARSFLEYYDAHQAAYCVPLNSEFAREYVVEVEGKQEYGSVAAPKDPQYPVEYADLEMYQRHPEIGAVFALVEWRERGKRGLLALATELE